MHVSEGTQTAFRTVWKLSQVLTADACLGTTFLREFENLSAVRVLLIEEQSESQSHCD
jgi:hypothetical protein